MLGHILSDPGVLLSSNWVNVEWILQLQLVYSGFCLVMLICSTYFVKSLALSLGDYNISYRILS